MMREVQPCAQFTSAREYGLAPDPPKSRALENLPQRVYSFDLENWGSKFVYLLPEKSGHNAGEDLIKAYWLPWKSGGITEMELRTDANYFFTSHLGHLPSLWSVLNETFSSPFQIGNEGRR